MTTLIVIWCIIGALITNMVFTDDGEDAYHIGKVIISALFGWIIGALVLAVYLAVIIPKLLYRPFNRAFNFFDKFIR